MSWDKIKHSINSQIGNPLDKQLEELLATLKTGVVPIVKSVQSGTYASSGDVTISSVNINKSIVLTSGDGDESYLWSTGGYYAEFSAARLGTYAYLKNSVTLQVVNNRYTTANIGYATIAWQVIEFY